MNLIFAAVALIFPISAKADFGQVHADQVSKYKTVLLQAVDRIKLNCDDPQAKSEIAKRALKNVINGGAPYLQIFFVDKTGAQPAIAIEVSDQHYRGDKYVNYFNTDSAHKNIVKVVQHQFIFEDINDGTIVNPSPRKDWVFKKAITCIATSLK